MNHKALYDNSLERRDMLVYTNVLLEIFEAGGGACNVTYAATDNVVALSSKQYNDDVCFNDITLTANGKTTQARVVDRCNTCPPGGLGLSESLSDYFANTSIGARVLGGSWFFTDDSDATTTPSVTAAPSVTKTPSVISNSSVVLSR